MSLLQSRKIIIGNVLALGMMFPLATYAAGSEQCVKETGLLLTNGKIITLDDQQSIASWIEIDGDRIHALGTGPAPESECRQIVDLKGKTVIPGLIDSHVHFLRQGQYPGYDAREAESATDIKSLISVLKNRSKSAPTDSVITVLGGIVPHQFAENRLPTNTELDQASSTNIVYLQLGFSGPAQTNSAGIEFLKAQGVDVDSKGAIASGAATNAAFAAIRQGQTEADRVRATQDLMKYANGLGLTTVFDEGGTAFPGASNFEPRSGFDTILTLWKNDKMTVRVRAQFGASENKNNGSSVENRLANNWSGFGDDKLKIVSMGEHVTAFPKDGKISLAYTEAVELIARAGWSHEQHSTSFSENEQHIAAIEAANAKYPIAGLRWTLSHVFELGANKKSMRHVEQLKAIGMGVRVQNHAYTAATDKFPLGRVLGGKKSGPLYRTLMDTELPMGAGTDGALLFPMNPWFSIYYMVSGRDVTGKLVNEDETLTRMEALQLYTLNNAKLSFEENALGSLKPGKLADFVVLTDDYLTVSEDELKNMRSVLTFVGGDVVYSDNSVLLK